jgi:hypothetical protein
MTDPDELVISSVAQRPELGGIIWQLSDSWPEFMRQDASADYYYADVLRAHPQFVLGAVRPDEPDRLVAGAFAVPVAMGSDVRRPALPDEGWDAIVRWGWLDRLEGIPPTVVSALEINIRRDQRGTGLSGRMLGEMRARVKAEGFAELVAPVRPSGKSDEPHTPMSAYAARLRSDGLPADGWLRTHVRAGGVIERVCSRSMVIGGSLREWRSWTGLPFDVDGAVVVPGALNPVHVDLEQDHAVYVEPNVWVRHRL